MNLKQRFSIIFSSLFSIVLALMMIILLSLFEQFRAEEFKQRLQEKAETTVKLLMDVEEVDKQLLKIIDQNTINTLYDEKVLIFNENFELIYSSLDDAVLTWNKADLEYLKVHQESFKRIGDDEFYGAYYDSHKNKFYALVKAEDKYGFSKLIYLRYLLIGSYIISNLLVWGLSFYLSKISLSPLDDVTNKIKEITEKNLNVRLSVKKNKDEISALSTSFNQMIDRIEKSYKKQKEFTSNASHELRTPISRIVSQLENIIIQNNKIDEALIRNIKSIAEDSYQLSELVSSLLILSRIDEAEKVKFINTYRLDEIIFNSSTTVSKSYPDYKLNFFINNAEDDDINLEIPADESLLKIAFLNLLKNAYLYSNDGTVYCTITPNRNSIQISIKNKGTVPDVEDTDVLFQSFYRGSNSANKTGSGLGLGITKRIVQYHSGEIRYNRPDNNTNEIIINFNF